MGMVKRTWKVAVLLAVGAAGAGTALAVASVPGSDGVISACVNVAPNGSGVAVPVTTAPNLEIIDTSEGQTCTAPSTKGTDTGIGQDSLQWSATGPQGPSGTPGAAGATGSAGLTGAIGPTLTIAGGNTLTLPNREVITVGSTLAPPAVKTAKLGTFTAKLLHQGAVGSGGPSSFSFTILGFQFGYQAPVDTSSGLPSGKRQHGTVTITKEVDSASPSLFKALVNNEVIKSVRIVLTKAGGGESDTITLTNAVLSGLQRSGAGEHPLETLTFAFQKVTVQFTKAN